MIAAKYWINVQGCVNTVSEPSVDAMIRLFVSPFRMVLNRKANDVKIRICPSMFVRK